jgi:hypothetical protein
MNNQYEHQTFRQAGHDKESPQSFLGRRVHYMRLLTVTDDGGPDEVQQIMCTAPIAWSSILIVENIRSVEDLYERINEHKEELVDVVARRQTDIVTVGNLSSTLKRLGLAHYPQSATSFPRREHRVNVTEAEEEEDGMREEGDDTGDDLAGTTSPEFSEGGPLIKSVYQALARRQRPPPKGGYPFKKNDHVTTKMGREPPSPCKVCGSSKHWDKECPDWSVYLEKQRRGVLTVVSSAASDEAELLYHSAYLVLMDGRMSADSF